MIEVTIHVQHGLPPEFTVRAPFPMTYRLCWLTGYMCVSVYRLFAKPG